MCGIAGIVDFNGVYGTQGLRDLAAAMSSTMVHRGPDSSGVWVDPTEYCAFSHRRLSIIDTTSAGHQPMESLDKRYCITFNGEIYNFQELKPEIEAKGHTFRTRTDTEVLIEAMRLWGTEVFSKLDGMYAFGLYDRQKKEIILGRDPFGEKPLYYIATPKYFAFASELQALQQLPFFDSSISADELAEYLCFQYIGAPRSLYRNVKKVPPGHYLVLRDDGSYTLNTYFSFRPGQAEVLNKSLDEMADELEDILLRSVRRRLISDVPLGAFLSGGVDSSTVVALIRKALGLPVKTFAIGFAETEETEHIAARGFAAHLETDHREKILKPDASRFLYQIGDLLDEPNGDSSCLPTYLLSEFARSEVTVAVSGDGGDEMFGGYSRYFLTLEEEARTREGKLRGWNPGNAYYSSRILVFPEEHVGELFGFIPPALREILRSLRREMDSGVPGSLLDRMRKLDVDNYMPGAVLPKVDRMSMRHSLEVRTPFLSMELARFAERLPLSAMYSQGVGKLVLRKIAYRYLPEEMVNTPKKGFGLPMSRWGCEELLKTAGELLEADDSKLSGCLGKSAVKRFMEKQKSPNGFSTYQVWALAVLESYLRHRPASLPDLKSGLSIETLPYIAPDCQELSLVHSFLERKQPVVLFCDDTFPTTLQALPEGSILVSRRAIRPHEGIESVRMDWSDEDFAWVNALPENRIQGTVAWFYPRKFACKMSVKKALILAEAGFRELIFSDAEARSYISLNLQQVLNGKGTRPKTWRPMRKAGKRLGHKRTLDRSLLTPKGQVLSSRMGNKRLIIDRLLRVLLRKVPLVARFFFARLQGDNFLIPHWQGYGYKVKSPFLEDVKDRELAYKYTLFEDDTPMVLSACSHADICRIGRGRYSVWNDEVIFSTTDNSDPNLNGRRYYLAKKDLKEDEAFSPLLKEAVKRDNQAPIHSSWPVPESKFVLLTHSLSSGGAERQWCCLARELDKRGYSVTMIVLDSLEGGNGHYLPLLQGTKVSVHSLKDDEIKLSRRNLSEIDGPYKLLLKQIPSYLTREVAPLFLYLKEIRPQYVLCQLDHINIIGGVAAWLAGVPRILLSTRNVNPSRLPYIYSPWFKDYYRMLTASQRVVLTGNSLVGNKDYAEWLGFPLERYFLIRNGLDTTDFDKVTPSQLAKLRTEFKLNSESRLISGVFRLSPEKQPFIFVEVVEKLHKRLPGLKALLVGEGPLHEELHQQIRKKGLGNTISLLGRREDVAAIIRLSDVFLLTSVYEGTPNVLLEAQYLGVPVVASSVGGVSDAMMDGSTGFMCPPNDPESMADRCLFLLTHDAERKKMGQVGHRFILDHFGIDNMVQKTIAALAEKANLEEVSKKIGRTEIMTSE
jgi:asparagine synthase (glutamine-hydrolysing)